MCCRVMRFVVLALVCISFRFFEAVGEILTHGQYEIEPFPHPEIPNCYTIRPHMMGRTFVAKLNPTTRTIHCLPSILVLGFPKCGTSALYGLLHLHPSTLGTVHKEYCIHENDIVAYLKGLPSPEKVQGKVLISGCLLSTTAQQIFQFLKPKSIKALFMIRDYAERAWAAYNFWCDPRIDFKCEKPAQWVTENHYRSPEMFHEIILAQHQHIPLNLWFPTFLQEAPRYYQDNIHLYAEMIPPQDLHVIDSNQLETSPDIVWKEIAEFLNHSLISSTAFHPQIEQFRSRRYNTQQNKGDANYEPSEKYQSQRYSISGNRSMLPRTREILTEHWKPDCLWLKETYRLSSLKAC
jgi:hypothetical protein